MRRGARSIFQRVSAGSAADEPLLQKVNGPGRIRARARRTYFSSIGQLIEFRVASSALTTDCGSGEKSSEGPNVCPPVIA